MNNYRNNYQKKIKMIKQKLTINNLKIMINNILIFNFKKIKNNKICFKHFYRQSKKKNKEYNNSKIQKMTNSCLMQIML